MARECLEPGDLVVILRDEWERTAGIVTLPISKQNTGHVLLHKDGAILGIDVSMDDVERADERCEGFAQLGYQLIKLGSHVIEQKLIVHRA